MSWRWPSKKLEIAVTLKTDDEILSLRARVCQLEAEMVAAQGRYNALEFSYRCECLVNAELVDLCRASNVKYRPSLVGRCHGAPGGPKVSPEGVQGGGGPQEAPGGPKGPRRGPREG